jgi:hypothetical protein
MYYKKKRVYVPGPLNILHSRARSSSHACSDISVRSVQKCLKDLPCIAELESQLVSETVQDIPAIPLGETRPVLNRVSCSILLLDGTGVQPDLVSGHIPHHILILVTGLVGRTGLEHQHIAIPGCTLAALTLSIPEHFLGRRIAGYLMLYIQAVACLVANTLCLSLLPGCHNGSRRKDKDQHCAQCYLLEHSSHSWRVGDD